MANRYKNISIDINAGMFSAASCIAPRFDIRDYLNAIYIKSSIHGGINIIATDGHRIIYFWDQTGFSSCDDIILPKNELMELIKLSKKSVNKDKTIKIRSSGKAFKASLNKSSFKFNLNDYRYPSIAKVLGNISTENDTAHSVLYSAKYILDLKHLFCNKERIDMSKVAIHIGEEAHFFAATKNGFYLAMPFFGNTNKHMLDYIYDLVKSDEDDILLKADSKNRGVEGYQFLKDLLGASKAKIVKKSFYG